MSTNESTITEVVEEAQTAFHDAVDAIRANDYRASESLLAAITLSYDRLAALAKPLPGVWTCPVGPGCNLSTPHVHHESGAVIYTGGAA